LSYTDRIEKLSKLLVPESSEDADAAVALLLKQEPNKLKVFLVKRVEAPTDPWSGHVALPGGKRDVKDQNLKQTVVRETLEETNIALLDRCRFLGVMLPIRSTKKPEMKVLPFVILLEHEPLIKLNEELERYVWVSLEKLVEKRGPVNFSFGEYPAFLRGNNVIWGLTYRILERFFTLWKKTLPI
jgi:8-oxo-dGTP pyrophosphatase MutT (NUDIX family)